MQNKLRLRIGDDFLTIMGFGYKKVRVIKQGLIRQMDIETYSGAHCGGRW